LGKRAGSDALFFLIFFRSENMSSVFKKPKAPKQVVTMTEVQPTVVDNTEVVQDIEKKRRRRMGAVSQILASGSAYNGLASLNRGTDRGYGNSLF